MLRTFLRSEIHATDSTLIGCRAKERGDRQAAPSQARSTLQNQKQEHRVGRMEKHIGGVEPSGFKPKIWQSRAYESQVSGCQSKAFGVRKAQTMVFQVSPARTWGLSVT